MSAATYQRMLGRAETLTGNCRYWGDPAQRAWRRRKRAGQLRVPIRPCWLHSEGDPKAQRIN